MRTIILTKGIPASGKSTWAEEEMKNNPGKYKRINKDLLREMLDCNQWTTKNEKFLLKVRDNIVESALYKGYDVIIDDTNLNDSHWEKMCDIAKAIGDVQVIEKYFDITLKEALERNSKRSRVVPDNVIASMYNKNIKNKHISPRKEYFPSVRFKSKYNEVKDNPNAFILDLDGTVALSYDRNVYDVKKVNTDTIQEDIRDLAVILRNENYRVIVISGRRDSCLEDTIKWLNKARINYDEIYLRQTGDNREDTVVKEEIYKYHIKPRYNVVYAFDDRPQVCRMWRKLGITVLQLNHIDF